MDITNFVSKPTVTELSVDHPAVIETYGEPITFHIIMPIPINEYVGLSKLSAAEFVKLMLVDKDGNKVITEGTSLSAMLITPINDRIWIELGKLPEKCSIQNPNPSI